MKFEGLETRSMLSASGDFNGDGADDLAISVPGYDVGSQQNAGAVNVIYGGDHGLASDGNQWWTLDSADVVGEARANDGFGTVMAVGDFNKDGFDDLAVGTPGKSVSGYSQAGAVTVLYGSSQGLRAMGNQFWSQDSQSINGHTRAGDRFGTALAAGDFDGDGYADLAVGTPGDDVGRNTDSGGVNVIYGSRRGLARAHDQLIRHPIELVDRTPDEYTTGKFFGSTLAAGDFDGDGHDDLAASMKEVTVPRYNPFSTPQPIFIGPLLSWNSRPVVSAPSTTTLNLTIAQTAPVAGGVDVLYGSAQGLSTSRVQNFLPKGQLGNPQQLSSEADDFFYGIALAAGDFNGDGRDDLAVGSPGAQRGVYVPVTSSNPLGLHYDVGKVHYYYSAGASGLYKWAGESFSAKAFGLDHRFDQGFGLSLAAGDFNHDGLADLAIGSPLAEVNGQNKAGLVAVKYGGILYGTDGVPPNKGLFGRTEVWHQDSGSILDSAEAGDLYGSRLIAGDYNGDGRADLGVSAPNENQTGAVGVIYASRSGLDDDNSQLWSPTSPGIVGNSQTGSSYGLVGGGYGTITQNGGTIQINGGTLDVTNSGYGVTLQGGTISGSGTFNMSGGSLNVSNWSNINIGYLTDTGIWNANGGILNINSATLQTPIGTLIRAGALPQNAQIRYDGVLYENVAQFVALNPGILS